MSRLTKFHPVRAGFLAMIVLGFAALGTFACLPGTSACSVAQYTMEILVDGRPVPEYRLGDTAYVEALRGREYSVRLRNMTGERIAVALSVDGLNSIDARATTAADATKWILGPWETLTLDGWQTSGATARRFFFTSEARSYGAWLGQTKNLGLISAAFFREQRPRPTPLSGQIHYPQRDSDKERYDPQPRGSSGSSARDAQDSASAQGERPDAPATEGIGANDNVDAARNEAPGSTVGGKESSPDDARESGGVRRKAPTAELKKDNRLSDELAATGIGRELNHPVRQVAFDEEPSPAAIVEVRYEFRDALARLGVPPFDRGLPGDLARRERARGFEGIGYAPDPYR